MLSNSKISSPSSVNVDVPNVTPNRNLNFASFASLFPNSDHSHLASVFRLGHALFDTLDDHLDENVQSDVRVRVLSLRRVDALSTWLKSAVSSSVEQELKTHASGDAAKLAFIHLSGNQVEKAVDALINGGDVRLASLIAQIPGDGSFRYDIHQQLRIWKEEKVDAFIDEDVLRLYALASGEIYIHEGSGNNRVEVSKGLDWLRAFALQVWYASMLDTTLRNTFEEYEERYQDSHGKVAGPIPWYSKSSSKAESTVTDGLFSLMKLALVTSTTLESTLLPLSFSPNPRDFSLCWFLYVLLSRSLRLRDFSDRRAIATNDDGSIDDDYSIDGYSLTADILTTSFASQLEQDGLVQEAAFVLLIMEDDDGYVFCPLLYVFTVLG